jgi:hypothetical protein
MSGPTRVVLAEKLCAAVALGAGNSYLRDYADVWTLTCPHDINIDGTELAGALHATAAHRGVDLRPISLLIADYATAPAGGYAAYLRRLGPDATRLPPTLADPILDATAHRLARWLSASREWGP